jgi:iron(III) transport system ATP-binding protein
MSLVLNGVTKVFAAKSGAHTAVRDLNLEIGPGGFHTLLGPSGCGKTTLLRMIAGFEPPTGGEIRYHGKRLNEVPPYQRAFPMVFQSYALFPHMTVLDNVAYGLRLQKLARAEVTAKAERALALLDLLSQRDRHPAQLSGGQQQRVALARALVLEPELILLDEPLSNLDAGLRVAMRSEIRALQQRLGITAIYVTHDQEEALAISDRIIVMNAGRIEQIGTPYEIHRQPRTEFVARFMGSVNVFEMKCDERGRLVLFGAALDLTCRADATHVVVRTDALRFAADGRYRATVAEATFLGARTQYRLATNGTDLIIERSADADAIDVGSEIRFDIAADRLHLLTP